jgi:indolepyruvate ferredoxin oxidoreductase
MGINLHDCYSLTSGPALISGTQALVRLLLEQARLDREAGLNTRGLVSGYPGSPLGGLDLELARSRRFLDEEGIVFQPAVNEELAATAIWGSQHIGLYDHGLYDGVFGLWYGKGPGLDRSIDALRHANQGGVAPKGGMVIAVGDDPTGKSSTLAYQSDQTFVAMGMPYFFPRRVEDIIPMGLQAFALSRHAGTCVGLKIVIDTADANVVLDMGSIRPKLNKPEDAGPVHVGRHDPAILREERLHKVRLPAVLHWQEENPVNFAITPLPKRGRLGIVAVGKAVTETREALHMLGIADPSEKGIALMSVAMPWPVEPNSMLDFAQRFDEILVIEEKRSLVEDQLAHLLVNQVNRPKLSGKADPDNTPLLPDYGELSLEAVIEAIIRRAGVHKIKLEDIERGADLGNLPPVAARTPYYCAGCPHNSSTKLPDGSVTGMGIGCHSISGFLTPDTITNFTQMGGEGAFWIGRAPFSDLGHTFQNLGDGTYTHSGYLAIRAAIGAGVNMTFKILYNDAVAMTGGQNAQGGSTPDEIARQITAEGASGVVVVSDDPDSLKKSGSWPAGTRFYHRRDLVAVQEDLARTKGVTGLIYVQTCAAELRRRRKRGKIPDRPERLFINKDVCEGCGDCAVKSNCVAVKPAITPEGIKKRIDQTVCNKDYSCREGFCPSFVSITGGADGPRQEFPDPPEDGDLPPPPVSNEGIRNIFLAGIGGTGVSTLSAVLVMAGRIEGISAQAVNQTGLSQKNGGVTSQVRMSRNETLMGRMVRLPARSTDLLIGCDAVVAVGDMALKSLEAGKSHAIISARVDPVGVDGVGTGHVVDDSLLLARLGAVMDRKKISHFDTATLSERLLGRATSANVMLLGAALQGGFLPVSPVSLEEALRLNGVDVETNLKALKWGRWLMVDEQRVLQAAGLVGQADKPALDMMPVAEAVSYFAEKLTRYQDQGYAARYRKVMDQVSAMIRRIDPDDDHLARKAARALFRVMHIKDEYEVARLMTSDDFASRIEGEFGKSARVNYHLAPPMMGWLRHRDGTPRKLRFGSWMAVIFRILTRMRPLRGTMLDPFGLSKERRRERAFRERVISLFSSSAETLSRDQVSTFEEMLEIVLTVRGFGHIKLAAMDMAEQQLKDWTLNQSSSPASRKVS